MDPEKLSFEHQVKIFRESAVIIGQMGAALANLIFCSPGTKVLALASPFTKSFCMQGNLASFSKCEYRVLPGIHPEFDVNPGCEDINIIMDSFEIDVSVLRQALEELTSTTRVAAF